MGEIAARGDVPLPGFSPPFCSKGVIGERGGEGEFLPSKSLSPCSLHAAMRGGFGMAQCPRLAAPEYTVMCEDLGEGIGADGCAGD